MAAHQRVPFHPAGVFGLLMCAHLLLAVSAGAAPQASTTSKGGLVVSKGTPANAAAATTAAPGTCGSMSVSSYADVQRLKACTLVEHLAVSWTDPTQMDAVFSGLKSVRSLKIDAAGKVWWRCCVWAGTQAQGLHLLTARRPTTYTCCARFRQGTTIAVLEFPALEEIKEELTIKVCSRSMTNGVGVCLLTSSRTSSL